MISVAAARKIILSMPEAEEQRHHGHPDFRVNNKIFATLWPDEVRAVLKIHGTEGQRLVKSDRRAFSAIPWGKHNWTNVDLNQVDARTFARVVEDAWYCVAPSRLTTNRQSL